MASNFLESSGASAADNSIISVPPLRGSPPSAPVRSHSGSSFACYVGSSPRSLGCWRPAMGRKFGVGRWGWKKRIPQIGFSTCFLPFPKVKAVEYGPFMTKKLSNNCGRGLCATGNAVKEILSLAALAEDTTDGRFDSKPGRHKAIIGMSE